MFYIRNVQGYSVTTAKHIGRCYGATSFSLVPMFDLAIPFEHKGLHNSLDLPESVRINAQALAEAEVARLQSELPKLRANAFRKRENIKHEIEQNLRLLEFILNHSKNVNH